MCDKICLTAKHRRRLDIQERSTNLILSGLSGTVNNFWRNSSGSWWYSKRNLWSNCKKEKKKQLVKQKRTRRRRRGRRRKTRGGVGRGGVRKSSRRRRRVCRFKLFLLLLLITSYTFFLFICVFDANKTLQNGLPVCRLRRWLLTFIPLSPSIHIQILQTDLLTFPYRISWENLFKDQIIFSWVIILLILITYLFTVYG